MTDSGKIDYPVKPGEAEKLQEKYHPKDRHHPLNTRGEPSTDEYAVPYYDHRFDEESRHLKAKAAVREASAKLGGNLIVPVSDKEIDFVQKLHETQTAVNYMRWLETAYDRKTPAERELFMRIFPQYKAMREKEIDNRAEIQKKIAKLKIAGIQSEEDAKFVWALTQGDIDPVNFLALTETKMETQNYVKGPFAPPPRTKAATALDELNRTLGFQKANKANTPTVTPYFNLQGNAMGDEYRNIAANAFFGGNNSLPPVISGS